MAVCTRPSHGGEKFGEACPECAHTNLVHPNPGNPGLSECQICVMHAVMAEVEIVARNVLR